MARKAAVPQTFNVAIVGQNGRLAYEALIFAASLRQCSPDFKGRLLVAEPQAGPRWVWAVVVDAMFVSMVFWGVSGLFMWWQIKRTRVVGAALLTLAVLFSVYLAVEMHAEFALAGGRGGR